MKISRVLGAIALAFIVVGCTAIPEVPYDRMTAGNIKTIGILDPSIPQDASVILATSPGQSFGLVGALVDASLQENRERSFKKMVQAQNFSARDTFMSRLTQRLEMNGYTTAKVSATRPGSNFFSKYPSEMNVDALLDLVVENYGYIAAGVGQSAPYRPRFAAKIRLVRASDSTVLMQDTVIYNAYETYANEAKGVVTIAPNGNYAYPDFNSMEANPEQAVTGLQDAINQSADAIGNLLR